MKVFEKLGVTARERWHMLILKAKFAGCFILHVCVCVCVCVCVHTYRDNNIAEGHNMASRLSKAITTESKKMKSLQLKYNSIIPVEDQLSWEDVTDLSLSIWLASQQEDDLPVPRSVRLTAIDALMKKK